MALTVVNAGGYRRKGLTRAWIRLVLVVLLFSLFGGIMSTTAVAQSGIEASFFDLEAQTINGETLKLDLYRNRVVLVVNTASRCGFTPQYAALEELYQRYQDRGFVVLGFPSNDFLGQEPGANSEIQSFCSINYGVTFPLFTKAKVSGDAKQAVYRFLTEGQGYGAVRWNFEKFLLNRSGRVLKRWRSMTSPLSSGVTTAIEEALAETRCPLK